MDRFTTPPNVRGIIINQRKDRLSYPAQATFIILCEAINVNLHTLTNKDFDQSVYYTTCLPCEYLESGVCKGGAKTIHEKRCHKALHREKVAVFFNKNIPPHVMILTDIFTAKFLYIKDNTYNKHVTDPLKLQLNPLALGSVNSSGDFCTGSLKIEDERNPLEMYQGFWAIDHHGDYHYYDSSDVITSEEILKNWSPEFQEEHIDRNYNLEDFITLQDPLSLTYLSPGTYEYASNYTYNSSKRAEMVDNGWILAVGDSIWIRPVQ